MSSSRMSQGELADMVRQLRSEPPPPDDGSADAQARVAHELLVHQLELEQQNHELRAAHQALEESRDRYSDLYDYAPVAYYTFDLKGCIRELNLTGATLLGRDRLRMMGQPFVSLAQVDPQSVFWEHIRRAVKTRAPVTSEWTLHVPAGALYVQAISAPVFGEGGDVVALRTSLSDISARRRAEVERDLAWKSERVLREQLARVDEAMRVVSEALAQSGEGAMQHVLQVIVDQARVLVSAEYAAFGFAGGAGEAFSSWIFSGATAAQALATGRKPLAVGPLGDAQTASLRFAELTEHPAIDGFPAQDAAVRGLLVISVMSSGKLLGNLYVANKIGALEFSAEDQRSAEMLAKRAGKALEIALLHDTATAAIQARDKLLAIVSHDLRNMLSVIALNATLLSRDPVVRNRVDGPAELIKRSTVRMGSLIQDLLDAATIEAGAFTVEPTPQSPEGLLEECAELQRPVLADKGIRLELESASDLPDVFCDAERVQQVFANLVGNAAKFTPAGGAIRLRARARADQLCFSVADSGCGIDNADLPKLFDRYWKGKPGGRQGTGLGLSIAQGIVQAHGGNIWVESELGVGTTVSFVLPLAREPAKPTPVTVPPQAEDHLKNVRVLLVDDEGGAVTALTALLTGEGLGCAGTTSAEHALALVAQEPPDILVFDMEMPEMNGLELLRRARERYPTLPAIVMSGYGLEHPDIESVLSAGSVAYLTKPVDVDLLLDLVTEQVATRRAS